MNWNRIKCALLGHDLVHVRKRGYMKFGIGAPSKCRRCGYEWEGLKYPPMPPRPRRQIIQANKMPAEPIVTNLVRIADFSYHAQDGSLQRVSLRKEGAEAPVLTVNGVDHRMGWLKG
jgi:hypothetical protein